MFVSNTGAFIYRPWDKGFQKITASAVPFWVVREGELLVQASPQGVD